MKPSFRSLVLALLTFLQASVALADAPLIWGPSNTARLLNSGELVGKNGDIYLHSAVPLIFPAADAKGPLLNNGSGTLSWLVGNNNSFTGFDSTGTMISIPGYTWDQTTQSLSANASFDPSVSGYTGYSLNAATTPTADNTNNVGLLNTFTNCGGDDSGFSCGDPISGAGGLSGINSGLNSTNKSPVGHVQLFNGYSQFGNGTDPIIVHDVNGMSVGANLASGVTMQYANEFTSNLQSAAGSSLGSLTTLAEYSNVNYLTQNYTGVQLNPTITTLDGVYNGFSDNANVTTSYGGYSSANFAPNIGAVSGSYNGLSISPNVASSSLTAAEFEITTVADVAQSLAGKYLTFCEPYTNGGVCWAPWFQVSGTGAAPVAPGFTLVEVDITTGDSAAAVGTALYGAVNALTANLTWTDSGTGVVTGTAVTPGQSNVANAQDSGFGVIMTVFGGGDGSATGLNVNMANATGFNSGNVRAISTTGNVNISGKLETGSEAPLTDQGGTSALPVNTINTNFTVAPGVTVNNADMFGFGPVANLTMGANSHANASPGLQVGASSLGMIGLITMDNGSTATNVNGSFIAQVLTGGTGAGGVIDDLNGYRAVTANFGSPSTVTNSRAFFADDILGAPATNHWGFYAKSSFENYMGKSLKIGGTAGVADQVSNSSVGLEIDPTLAFLPDPMTTTVRDALTPITGMLINNSTTNQLERYDGAVWSAVGGGGSSSWTVSGVDQYSNVAGKVGIGTTAPAAKLSIDNGQAPGNLGPVFPNASIVTSGSAINNSIVVNDNDYNLYFNTSSAFANAQLSTYNYTLGSAFPLGLNTNGGNVSIGTTPGAPASQLTVSGNTSIGAGYFTTPAPSNGLLVEGNVGIGTTSPAAKFSIQNGQVPGNIGPFGSSAILVSGANGNSTIVMNDVNNNEYFYVDAANNYGSLSTYNYTAGGPFPLALNANGGNVAVGPLLTFTPSNQLTVSGNASIGGGYYSLPAPTQGLIVAGNVGLGTPTPGGALDVQGRFVIDGSGYISKINALPTTYPIVQGAANTFLKNDGSGNLTWNLLSGSNVPLATNVSQGTVPFYESTTKTTTVGGATTSPAVTVKEVRVGDLITIQVDASGKITKNGSNGALTVALDSDFGNVDVWVPNQQIVGNVYQIGMWRINGSTLSMYNGAQGSNISAGTTNCGWDLPLSFSFTKI